MPNGTPQPTPQQLVASIFQGPVWESLSPETQRILRELLMAGMKQEAGPPQGLSEVL